MIRKRLVTRKTQTAIATGVAATFIGAWATHFIGPPSKSPPSLAIPGAVQPPSEPSAETLLAESRISFADWQALVKQAFDMEQRKAIFERYRGEQVTWQGYVDAVNRISPENGGSSAAQFVLVFYEDRETLNSQSLGRAPALCIFPRNAEDELNKLQHGQRIVLQGTFAAAVLHGQRLGTRLYNCKLIEVR